MDAFTVHKHLIRDYQQFTEGFVDIHDAAIRDKVEAESARGAQWPAPWLSLNPSFAPGGAVDDLVADGILHKECARIFRAQKRASDPTGKQMVLHQHQVDAIDAAASGSSYVLTTGTGSGKSLAYIVPIVDRVLREGPGRGIRAIVVYPMNALANSQMEELRKFLQVGYDQSPVTFARYTGQESREERELVLSDSAQAPDILLTNYVMLELMLTRPDERRHLARAAKNLRFLVLDELHTYRGRQGADVAMLVRRVRDACGAQDTLQCVGTSATMSNGGTLSDQQRDVAAIATDVFGTMVYPQRVITESLVRATTLRDPDVELLADAVNARGGAENDDPALHKGFEALREDPLASWIEDTFGVTTEVESGRLIRRVPTTVDKASEQLAALTGRSREDCATAIRATLLAGSRVKAQESEQPLFAFRLHQFLSKGGSVYLTAEPVGTRAVETEYQLELPGGRRLFPAAFCRECGQDYLLAERTQTDGAVRFRARQNLKPTQDGHGYLYVSRDREWPTDPIAENRLPSSWRQPDGSGHPVVPARRKDIPVRHRIGPDGSAEVALTAGDPADPRVLAAWIPGVFRFCLRCGVSYEQFRSSEFAKLVTLNTEGRSSAMTVVASSIVRTMRSLPHADLPRDARKLLTFVDNRQDASLQAGHFNDFALVIQIRAALHRAVMEAEQDGDGGVDPLELGTAVTKHLGLSRADYDAAPTSFDDRRAKRALRGVVEYRTLRDLQRGWRVTLPNLEQSGLLIVDYPLIQPLAAADERWHETGPLRNIENSERVEIMRILLDEFRRVLAVDAEALETDFVDRLRRESREHLAGLWALPETEPDPTPGIVIPGTGRVGGPRNALYLSGRGMFGRWLRHSDRFGHTLSTTDADLIIASLLKLLADEGILTRVTEGPHTGYRLKSSAMLLRPGSGEHGAADPLRRRFEAETRPRVVEFFRDLYRDTGHELAGLHAAEHTAQVRPEDRQEREAAFRGERDKDVALPLLFCSPTMELGVDISSLNAVGMRNVPPTPANYAQRSGRAGRSGEPALVVTYCASGNSHDTYYFQRSELMVAGQVQPPRLDLANEDLIKSHIQAVWLAETTADLKSSMSDVLNLEAEGFPLKADLVAKLKNPDARERAIRIAGRLLSPLRGLLEATVWWKATWPSDVVGDAITTFDRACDRWRGLYTTTVAERTAAYEAMSDVSSRKSERDDAELRLREARQRAELLLNETDEGSQSDFYTYRYLASEGFLPGYSFPRLPLAAYIPGYRGRGNAWLQRPRFLAVREFGPGALIYHEGARYQVSRINLPRSTDAEAAGQVVLTEARICESCGYHHPRRAEIAVCESCGTRLPDPWKHLLQMQSVVTRRRERISSDEEERNRIGFELRTTYSFVPRNNSPGRLDATIKNASGEAVAELSYGDGAQVRVTNLGRTSRRNKSQHGFYLDLIKGRWLSEREGDAQDDSDEDDLEAGFADVKRKERVIPYVEDRRNIVVLRWVDEITIEQATTLQYALERGIEAVFQLEDSELASELLPDGESRGRLLLQEAAEGGAGVLRRIQAEPDALSRVSAEALRIMHVDPVTLSEQDDACVRGCYRCLLSFGNQQVHEMIDRRQVIAMLHALTTSATNAVTASVGPEGATPSNDYPGRLGVLLGIVQSNALRWPTEIDTTLEGLHVDLVYHNGNHRSAVLVDFEPSRSAEIIPLVFGGWNVVTIAPGDDLNAVIAAHPGVFGEAAR
ncbi:DEAD/DEAH box helicase [Catelliglobosispora koreensis]|uniref:DEAD/DEAH box helicase n=1 Tax=Catelliglobosispora koreensis TaxID=129052 RepID=UPI00036AA910|nr:DEAD/DEAH box helicase [Catelliglobosispora koreensis]